MASELIRSYGMVNELTQDCHMSNELIQYCGTWSYGISGEVIQKLWYSQWVNTETVAYLLN